MHDHLRRAMGLSMFGFFALSRPAPWQAPQSAHREDDGEERGHAEREECPDEEETPAAGGPEADSRPSHVDDGDAHQQERREEDDDIPRSPFGQNKLRLRARA